MRSILAVSFLLSAWLFLPESVGAQPAAETPTPGVARDLWTSRLGLFLGPQYFLERDDLVQFSFGAEGLVRLVGPLSAGLALGLGVIDETSASGQACLRLHLLRNRKLTLGLDLRGGALLWFSGGETRAEPVIQGGLELAHDLGGRFWILVRAGLGWVPGEDRGTLADLSVGLGLNL